MSEIGGRIQKRRKELGFSGEYVANFLNVDKTTIYRYEKGEIEKLPISIISKLAQILQTTPQYLMGWSEQKESTENNISQRARAVARKYDGLSIDKQKALDLLISSMREDDEDDE